jgi:MFS family permease
MSSQFQLLKQTRFAPFFYTQFLGAFNDNVFKTALITLVAFHASTLTDLSGAMLATVLPGLFILPFFLFSATAGQIADKYEKSQLIRLVKLFEIGIMLFAAAGFYLHSIWLLGVALFMMGMHSTLFGPVKYAYLPQHLQENELIGGNGMVEMGTFVAILLGQVLGAWMANKGSLLISLVIISLAVLGYITSRGVPHSPAAAPEHKINWNPATETVYNLRSIWAQQEIWLGIIAISWFWFYGATLLTQFPNFAKTVLHGNESVFILLLSIFSIGVGIGSLMCEKLSKGKVELGLVLFGGIGMGLFGLDLSGLQANIHAGSSDALINASQFMQHLSHWRLLVDIFLLGIFGGFYIVPLYTLIQTKAKNGFQSRVIAANNIMNALFMVISALVSASILQRGFSIPQLFMLTALLHCAGLVYLCWRQPMYLTTFVNWIKKD